jgi:hypothetical protein
MRRALALWLLLFGVYAATLKLEDYGGAEPHYLAITQSLAGDRELDLADEPYGIGFPLLILPAYELAGETGAELLIAALAGLAVALAYRLALRAAPDPWALGAAVAVGLTAPLLASSTELGPNLPAAAALTGAALLALRIDERPGWRRSFACFALLAALPWLGMRFLPAAVVIGAFAARTIWRSRRRTLAVGSVELGLFSVALLVGINEALYDSPTPSDDPLASASLDGFAGLRWAPLFLLALVGAWWLWRSRRDGLARVVPLLHGPELTAGLCAAVIGVQLLTAAFVGGRLLCVLPLAAPLVALGLRRVPRVGIALIAATLALSGWVYADARWGDGSLSTVASHQPSIRLTNLLGLSA